MPFFPFFGGGGGSELDPAQTEGPAADTALANRTEHDAPLPPGMMTGSIHDEIAREQAGVSAEDDIGRSTDGGGSGGFDSLDDVSRGEFPPTTAGLDVDGGANWWERDTLDGMGEGEELLDDPWATGGGADEGTWGDGGSSDWQ